MEENKRIDEQKAQLMDILLKDEPLSVEDEALCVCCSMDSPCQELHQGVHLQDE